MSADREAGIDGKDLYRNLFGSDLMQFSRHNKDCSAVS